MEATWVEGTNRSFVWVAWVSSSCRAARAAASSVVPRLPFSLPPSGGRLEKGSRVRRSSAPVVLPVSSFASLLARPGRKRSPLSLPWTPTGYDGGSRSRTRRRRCLARSVSHRRRARRYRSGQMADLWSASLLVVSPSRLAANVRFRTGTNEGNPTV